MPNASGASACTAFCGRLSGALLVESEPPADRQQPRPGIPPRLDPFLAENRQQRPALGPADGRLDSLAEAELPIDMSGPEGDQHHRHACDPASDHRRNRPGGAGGDEQRQLGRGLELPHRLVPAGLEDLSTSGGRLSGADLEGIAIEEGIPVPRQIAASRSASAASRAKCRR